jgi:redox-sensitive bicupin YhaK (pirin superfamily)
MDQMGEVDYAPGEPKGTPWHPHRGFETVTYMMDGTFEHQDSNGGGGVITNGDTQWMTAGAGILHIEKPPEWLVTSGGLFHGIQLWVNLPKDQKWAAPRYQDLRASEVALLSSSDGGALSGSSLASGGPSRPRLDLHADDARPRDAVARRAPLAALAGRLQRARLRDGRFGRRRDGEAADPDGSARGLRRWQHDPIDAEPIQDSRSPALDVLILGAGRSRARRVMGPFVMNTREELLQAYATSRQAARVDPRSTTPARTSWSRARLPVAPQRPGGPPVGPYGRAGLRSSAVRSA